MSGTVLVRAGIERFAVFAVDPAVTVGIGVARVGTIRKLIRISKFVVIGIARQRAGADLSVDLLYITS